MRIQFLLCGGTEAKKFLTLVNECRTLPSLVAFAKRKSKSKKIGSQDQVVRESNPQPLNIYRGRREINYHLTNKVTDFLEN